MAAPDPEHPAHLWRHRGSHGPAGIVSDDVSGGWVGLHDTGNLRGGVRERGKG